MQTTRLAQRSIEFHEEGPLRRFVCCFVAAGHPASDGGVTTRSQIRTRQSLLGTSDLRTTRRVRAGVFIWVAGAAFDVAAWSILVAVEGAARVAERARWSRNA